MSADVRVPGRSHLLLATGRGGRGGRSRGRRLLLEPYLPWLHETLTRYPRLASTRLSMDSRHYVFSNRIQVYWSVPPGSAIGPLRNIAPFQLRGDSRDPLFAMAPITSEKY